MANNTSNTEHKDEKNSVIERISSRDNSSANSTTAANNDPEENPNKLPWYRYLVPNRNSYDTEDERKFVLKLDLILITWAMFSAIIKSIDQSNINSAYVSGMKEELSFGGRQYNWLDSWFRIGYSIGLIPSQVILSKVKATYWLPSCEIIWGILTGLCSIVQSPRGLYPLRFFIGILEASSWPGMITVLFSYYNLEELSFRISVFGSATLIGNCFVGFMQAAIHETLNGTHGISGWRWMFIINGIMTVVVASFGYFCIPDTPANGGSRFWMSEREVEIANERMNKIGRTTVRRFKFGEFKAVALDWKAWLFIITWLSSGLPMAASYFNLWLKSLTEADGELTYGVTQLNIIPIGGYLIGLLSLFTMSKLSDYTNRRLEIILFQLSIVLTGYIILAVWPESRSAKFAGFYIIQFKEAVGPQFIAFLAPVYNKYPLRRSLTTGAAVAAIYSFAAWVPLYLWPADDAPNYKYGYKVSIMFIVLTMTLMTTFYFKAYLPAVKAIREEKHLDKEPQKEDDDGFEVESRAASINNGLKL